MVGSDCRSRIGAKRGLTPNLRAAILGSRLISFDLVHSPQLKCRWIKLPRALIGEEYTIFKFLDEIKGWLQTESCANLGTWNKAKSSWLATDSRQLVDGFTSISSMLILSSLSPLFSRTVDENSSILLTDCPAGCMSFGCTATPCGEQTGCSAGLALAQYILYSSTSCSC